jgi:FGGY-family pentulose kinase
MGEPIADGLTEQAADDLGLAPGTAVGVSIIDAHAGGLGVLGARLDERVPAPEDLERRVALIGGTSSCHMAVSREPRFVRGVWGPYYAAMVPGLWLTEGGQSATGALVDHIIFAHARGPELRDEARTGGRTVYELLNARLEALSAGAEFPAQLARELHVLPYFLGNRSPRADPTLRGAIWGLRLSDTVDDLALSYLAAIQAIAHGTRHIIDTMNEAGYRIDTIFACGGGTKNPVFLREHADVTGCRIVLPREPEAVLLGAAILGAVAAGDQPSVLDAMAAMTEVGETIVPAGGAVARFHEAKHRVFHRMYEDHLAYRELIGA